MKPNIKLFDSMKHFAFVSAIALGLLATGCCCKTQTEVTAMVGEGNNVVALKIDYAQVIDPESVCAETFAVEGMQVVCAKATECGKVIVLLKKACKEEACGKCEKAEGEKCAKEGAECKKGEGEQCKKGGECKKGVECKKSEGEQCANGGECQKAEGEQCHKDEQCKKAEGEKCKSECKKSEGCQKEVAVPEISVKQIANIKTTDGKTIKAWCKAQKATKVMPIAQKGNHCEESGNCEK